MKTIKLTQGQVALVDDADFEVLNQFKWYTMKSKNTFYAVRNITVGDKLKTVYMHWEIMGGKWVDHVKGNGLDNQRSNLRFCTQSENIGNSRKQKNTSSSFKGVYWDKQAGKWRVQIIFNNHRTHLGLFTNEIEAAKSYNVKAIELFGEFANINVF